MSCHPRFDTPEPVPQIDTAPVVLRFASMFPRDLKRREMHDRRKGGDLSHVRKDLSHLNVRPVGDPDWIPQLLRQVERAAADNLKQEIAARETRGRHKEARKLRERGPVDPWKFTRAGPLREGILTVNKRWFGGAGQEDWDPDRVAAFQQRALDFLREHFPDAQLREVSFHQDEEAFHIHFIVAVWVEKVSENRGRQRLLQPSANPLFGNYEYAQDLAGEAFLDLGIHRGERRARAAREAKADGLEGPEPRAHVPPSQWRKDQRRKALQDADRIKRTAADRAETMTSNASDVARSTIRKTRKRAVKEAQARRAEADQVLADARIARQSGRLAAAFIRGWNARLAERAHECRRDVDRMTARLADRTAEVRRAEKRAEELQGENAAARMEAEQDVAKAQETARRIRQTAADRAEVVVTDARDLARTSAKKVRQRVSRDARTRKISTDRAIRKAEEHRRREESRAAVADLDARAAEAGKARVETEARDLSLKVSELSVEVSEKTARLDDLTKRTADQITARETADAERLAAERAQEDAEAARADAARQADQAKRDADGEEARASKATNLIEAVGVGLTALAEEVAAGSTRCPDDEGVCAETLDKLRPVYPQIAPAAKAADDVIRAMRQSRLDAAAIADTTARAYREAQANIQTATEQLVAERKAVRDEWSIVTELRRKLEALTTRIRKWLTQPGLPRGVIDEGDDILLEAKRTCPDTRYDGPGE